jgi:hypothetical protein
MRFGIAQEIGLITSGPCGEKENSVAVVLLAPALVPRRAWVLGSNETENSLEDSGDLAHRIGRSGAEVTGYGNDSRQSRPSEQQTIAMNGGRPNGSRLDAISSFSA